MEKILSTYIGELKRLLDELAHDAMAHPKSEQFEHGRVSGIYQGVKQSLDILEAVMAEAD